MVAYTINDAMVKSIAYKYPVGEVIFVRGVMTAALIGAAVLALGHARELRHATNKPLLIRSVFDGLSTACFIAALVHMKLADLAAMLQISPLILTALSVLFYRETGGLAAIDGDRCGLRGRDVGREADTVGIRHLGIGGDRRRDVVGAARNADPAHRPKRADRRDRLHGFDRNRGRRRVVRRNRRVAPDPRPRLGHDGRGRAFRRHRHLFDRARIPWRRPLGGGAVPLQLSHHFGYRRIFRFQRIARRLVGGRSRPDRGQRPICPPPRSGAPSRDHCESDDRRQ